MERGWLSPTLGPRKGFSAPTGMPAVKATVYPRDCPDPTLQTLPDHPKAQRN